MHNDIRIKSTNDKYRLCFACDYIFFVRVWISHLHVNIHYFISLY